MGSILGEVVESDPQLEALRSAVRLAPTSLQAQRELAAAFAARGAWVAAEACFGQIVRLAPNDARARLGHGKALLAIQDTSAALQELEASVALDPRCVDALAELAAAHLENGEVEQAIRLCASVLESVPRHAAALLTLARAHRATGSFALARKVLMHALDAGVSEPDALLMLADLECYDLPALGETRLKSRLTDPALRAPQRRDLLFTLARVQEHLGSHDDAFRSYEQGNAIQRELGIENGFDYRPEARQDQVDRAIRNWTADYRAHLARQGHSSPAPVFIVGLPRSGTTLVEQMLSAHPAVYGAGERSDLPRIAAEFERRFTAADGRFSRHVPRALFGQLAGRYLEHVAAKAGGARRILDKNPHNFEHVGLITALFTHARIIHCRRDPYDTCASIYTQVFHLSHGYATDLQWLAHYHRSYRRLMAHWRSLDLPGLCEVQYEALVENPQRECRRLLDHLGLEWDGACLAPERNRRAVLTPTASQIRRPVHRGAVGRWRRFEAQLLSGLGELEAEPAPRSMSAEP